MAMNETLYDQVVTRLKNNKLMVFVLIAFAVLLAVAQLQGALSGIKNALFPPKTRVQVAAFIQRYDFMVGNIESPKPLATRKGSIPEIAQTLAKDIGAAIGPAPGIVQATLQIDGSGLRADQKLRAAVLIFVPPMSQVARTPKDVGEADNLDLTAIFNDPQYVDHADNSIDMELVPRMGYFEREPLKIFRSAKGFSFDGASAGKTRTIQFNPHTPRVLLATFEAAGEPLQNARTALTSALRTELARNPALELSPSTEEELAKEKREIQALGPGPAKSALANEHNADYIVTGTVVAP
jgi:hypothetical protein